VGDEHHGRRQRLHQGQDVVGQGAAGDLVQGREGLVQQQQARAGDQGAGQGDAHRHAARQLGGPGGLGVGQPDPGQGFDRLGPGLAVRRSGQFQGQGDIGRRAHPGGQGRGLEHHRGLAAARGASHGAAGRRLQPGQQPQGGGLATARRPDQGDDLAGRHGQIDRAQGATATGIIDLDLIQGRDHLGRKSSE